MAPILTGYREGICEGQMAWSTYHHIVDGRCCWCNRTEADLFAVGAKWIDVLGREVQPPNREEPR